MYVGSCTVYAKCTCAVILLQTVYQKNAAGMCRKVAAKYVPEEKFAYEKYTCCTLAANCAQEVCISSVCRKVAANCVPEKKNCIRKVYLQRTCMCSRNMQQECAARLQQSVCQRKKMHTKSILAAHLQQTVLQMYAARVCQKCGGNSVPEKKFAYEKYTSYSTLAAKK
jgi:hypothetical protein